jgi:hypothetical protein
LREKDKKIRLHKIAGRTPFGYLQWGYTIFEIAQKLLSEEIGLSKRALIALIQRMTGLSKNEIQSLPKKH